MGNPSIRAEKRPHAASEAELPLRFKQADTALNVFLNRIAVKHAIELIVEYTL